MVLLYISTLDNEASFIDDFLQQFSFMLMLACLSDKEGLLWKMLLMFCVNVNCHIE